MHLSEVIPESVDMLHLCSPQSLLVFLPMKTLIRNVGFSFGLPIVCSMYSWMHMTFFLIYMKWLFHGDFTASVYKANSFMGKNLVVPAWCRTCYINIIL